MEKEKIATSWRSHMNGTHALMRLHGQEPEEVKEMMEMLAKDMTNEDWEACRTEVVFLEQLFKYKKR